jgi:hypothetical protein
MGEKTPTLPAQSSTPSQPKVSGQQSVIEVTAADNTAETIDITSVTSVSSYAISTPNWYKIESEETKALAIETLRRIEEVLNIDLGVRMEA